MYMMAQPQDSVKGSSTSRDLRCVPCSEDNKTCVAVCFCTSCIEYLCDTCYTNHKRFKMLRNHTFLKGPEMPKDISHFVRMSTLGYCKLHPGREIEYRCINHSDYVCSSCVTVTHRNCKNLECIDTIYCDQEKLKGKYLERMSQLNSKIHKLSARKITHADRVETKTIEEENAAKTFIAEVKNSVCSLEQSPQINLINFVREEATGLTKCLEACEQSRRKIEDDEKLIETVLKHGNKTQILMLDVEIRQAEEGINDNLESYENSENNFPTKIISDAEQSVLFKLKALVDKRVGEYCKPSSSAIDKQGPERGPETEVVSGYVTSSLVLQTQNFVDKMGLNSELKLDSSVTTSEKATTTIKYNSNMSNNISSDSAKTHNKKESSLLGKTLQKVSEHAINIYKPSAKKCCHSRSILLADGKMIILDEANCVLKLISKDFQVLHSENLRESPQDIAVSRSGEIAVAYNKEIFLYEMTTTTFLKETQIFYTKYPITSMATLNDHLAILSVRNIDRSKNDSDDDSDENSDDEYEITVQIRTFRNKILVDKNNFVNANGQPVNFTKPISIRIRKNDEIIILEKRQFKVFGINGQLKWFCKFNLKHLSGMTFDTENNIYVCDKSTKNIRQVAANNFMKNRLLVSTTESPISILFNSQEKTIILGFEDNNAMHVYKFA